MERGGTEVRSELDLEPMTFGVMTYHFEIKRMWRVRIPGGDHFPCKVYEDGASNHPGSRKTLAVEAIKVEWPRLILLLHIG